MSVKDTNPTSSLIEPGSPPNYPTYDWLDLAAFVGRKYFTIKLRMLVKQSQADLAFYEATQDHGREKVFVSCCLFLFVVAFKSMGLEEFI